MYRDSGKIVQDRCWASQGLLSAFGMNKQVGVVAGRGRVQPIQFPRDPEARFIKVDDIRFPQARHGHRLERRRLDRTAFQDIEDRAQGRPLTFGTLLWRFDNEDHVVLSSRSAIEKSRAAVGLGPIDHAIAISGLQPEQVTFTNEP